MAEASNANGLNEAARETDKHDCAIQQPIRIDQFWDENRLVLSWMKNYLPSNRMWEDGIATVIQLFSAFCIFTIIFHVILKADKILAAVCLVAFAYIFGSFNARMARAQQKFFIAKKDKRNGWGV